MNCRERTPISILKKVSKRTNLDIASVNSAIHLVIKEDRIESAGLSAGGVGPVPMYLQKTSEFLTGKPMAAYLVDEAIDIMQTEISPISDARGSKEYKTFLLGQLIRAHLTPLNLSAAAEDLPGTQPFKM